MIFSNYVIKAVLMYFTWSFSLDESAWTCNLQFIACVCRPYNAMAQVAVDASVAFMHDLNENKDKQMFKNFDL